MIKPEVKTVLYPEVRHLIEVGDFIGCRGGKLISRLIRMFRGGVMNMSHAAIIVESSKSPSERVKVFEALGGPGMVRTLLTDAYEHDHGEIFWAPMKNNELEQDLILDEIERIEIEDCDTQLLEIIKVLADARDIAAVERKVVGLAIGPIRALRKRCDVVPVIFQMIVLAVFLAALR